MDNFTVPELLGLFFGIGFMLAFGSLTAMASFDIMKHFFKGE